jgi:4-hydroxy 2-oxovalerate aldolase
MTTNAAGGPALLDVTLRDGGYLNDHGWTVAQAAAVVRAVAAAGIAYAEVGYLTTPPCDPLRPSACCDEGYLEALAACAGGTGLVVMVRPGAARISDLDRLVPHRIAMVRVAAPVERPEVAAPFVERAGELGLAVAVNFTRASEHTPEALAGAALAASRYGASHVYLADSNGSLFPEGVAARVEALAGIVAGGVGFHAHDNLQLAFSNTRAALRAGARLVDASVAGIGKGGGNLRAELIASYLATHHGARLRVDPLLALHALLLREIEVRRANEPRAMVGGLLDLNLDHAAAFEELADRDGLDAAAQHWLAERRGDRPHGPPPTPSTRKASL